MGCGEVELGVRGVQGENKTQVKGIQMIRTDVAWISSLGILRERAEGKKSGMSIPAPHKALRREEVAFSPLSPERIGGGWAQQCLCNSS